MSHHKFKHLLKNLVEIFYVVGGHLIVCNEGHAFQKA
jgi:hypothetical protein